MSSNAAPGEVGSFAPRLLAWFDRHGRTGLPWQNPRTAYRVWLSEIMLQQTQVTAVIPYFERFVARFPDVDSLARAEPDEVMRLWAGLGYYARARNLHAAAREIATMPGSELPSSVAGLQSLPGIGRSTAAAIVAQAFGRPAAILDGNVRRVLCRWAGIEGLPASTATQAALWVLAEALLPAARAADYVQAQMDLGATVCTSRRPACERCPLADDCVARQTGRTADLPAKKTRTDRPHREAWLLLLQDDHGRLLLERRPGAGIWGGLWCPPVVPLGEDRATLLAQGFGLAMREEESGEAIEHGFTHYDLTLHPLRGRAVALPGRAAEPAASAWHSPAALCAGIVALPAPIARYFERQAAPVDLPGNPALASVATRKPRRAAARPPKSHP